MWAMTWPGPVHYASTKPHLEVGHEHEVASLAEVAAQRLLEDVAQHGARLGPLVAVLVAGSDEWYLTRQKTSQGRGDDTGAAALKDDL